MKLGEIGDISELYFKGRFVLVKSEKLYDAYDRAYIEFIESGGDPKERIDELMKFLDEDYLGEVHRSFEDLPLNEILRRFNERLMNQKEKHTGGGRHIGQRGYSPFGSYGVERDGIRVGGSSVNNRAFFVASERHFKNLREDILLDTRNISLALKKLRYFREEGVSEEVDIEETIDKTAKNFGDIEIEMKKERKNDLKLLLLIDNGGSMDPYRERVERLFSAAKNLRFFKDFKYFYFHNCIYDFIYEDMENWKKISTDRLIRDHNPDWKVIIIGDALMSPYELYNSYQFIYFLERKGKAGIDWLKIIKKHFRHSIWLNPVNGISWQHQTLKAIASIFPMFPLTIEGIERGVKELKRQIY